MCFFAISTIVLQGKIMNEYSKPDFYSKKAKEEGYVARSVYKLKEIDKKFNLLKKGQTVLDIGCAPGSWSQFVSEKIGSSGRLLGVDYKEIKVNFNNAIFLTGNFFSDEIQEEVIKYSKFDGVISDMAPDTIGDRVRDCFKSSQLTRNALEFCYNYLKTGGYFVTKIFQGGEEKEIVDEMKNAFSHVKWFKPNSSRKISYEIFIIGIDFIARPKNNLDNFEDSIKQLDNNNGFMPW